MCGGSVNVTILSPGVISTPACCLQRSTLARNNTSNIPHSECRLSISSSRVMRSVLTRMLVKGGGEAIACSSCNHSGGFVSVAAQRWCHSHTRILIVLAHLLRCGRSAPVQYLQHCRITLQRELVPCRIGKRHSLFHRILVSGWRNAFLQHTTGV